MWWFFSDQYFWFLLAGCSGSSHLALLIFSAWNGLWNRFPAVLRLDGQLDCLSHKYFICRIQNQEREGESWFQKPCDPGSSPHQLLFSPSNVSFHFLTWVFNLFHFSFFKVVWSSWWPSWKALEKCRFGFQLHFPPVWISHSAHSLCKVFGSWYCTISTSHSQNQIINK